ncbi:MAG: methyltransferase domain-containing protein [Beijerinckiaceae bacterium]|nr:methyltransferase domain-containing protein [Beijerinckiaceae bacterium]
MHDTALATAKKFLSVYNRNGNFRLLDIGSQDINGSIRTVVPTNMSYLGIDFVPGKGVDVILEDPYVFPLEDCSFDYIVTSSCFEHSDFFWLLFLEVLRVLKDDGVAYINAPSNGSFHQFPVDCWRFYPDSGLALEKWASRNGYSVALLESFIGNRGVGNWNDFVAVFIKNGKMKHLYKGRMVDNVSGDFYNGYRRSDTGELELLNYSKKTEDQRLIDRFKSEVP